ncbi:MAG TPA: SDR family oxidoreductase [Phenylobacterium sp.]|uniref:SDR family NAD(P)-dependent oxidoreductase n=1 Tax=Phenylobacterium sp. TaxID=1871053 RepID=UPI002B4A98B8|nr:SDR family oxidoreductase [Phenylobacterium sp.]HKR89320.1 SDR family oxidoreductase [Phenylobacterium sp.]
MSELTPAELFGLRGRPFVLIGGGEGLGLAIARHLRAAGAEVLVADRDLAMAAAVAEQTGAVAFQADALDRESLRGAFEEAARRFGEVQGVVDIIGIAKLQPLRDFTDDDWAWQFEMVVRHAFLTLQIGAEYVVDGGSFTMVGSLSGSHVVRRQTAYGSAKAALHHLVRGAALEYAARGVRVNAIAPGFIRTPRLEQLLSDESWRQVEGAIPLGRAAKPADIAGGVLFLASDLAKIVTGQILPADGGVSVAAALPDLDWRPR